MPKTVDYFTTPLSPWTYLGHDRFVALAARHGASVRVLPMDLGKVLPKIANPFPLSFLTLEFPFSGRDGMFLLPFTDGASYEWFKPLLKGGVLTRP